MTFVNRLYDVISDHPGANMWHVLGLVHAVFLGQTTPFLALCQMPIACIPPAVHASMPGIIISLPLPSPKKSKPLLPLEILAIIIDMTAPTFCFYRPGFLSTFASLCTLGQDFYWLITKRLYHSVVLLSPKHILCFIRTLTNNSYLAGCVVNLWVGDSELEAPYAGNQTDKTIMIMAPYIPNLRRLAINGRRTSIQWAGLACNHLTISDLSSLTHPIPTLHTLHLVNPLVSADIFQARLDGYPALHTVIFEVAKPIDVGALLQFGVMVVKTVPRLQKLIFRIEDFWMLHTIIRILPAKLVEEGLGERVKEIKLRAVWSWELGIDLCGIWIANGCKSKIGKEHKITCLV
ncbi:hypothetical protein FRC12_015175 [Ceratobasidium sp. 428]|nr:hypothetical protein FRC12_015175 [Ceratobasidium sp. 428]